MITMTTMTMTMNEDDDKQRVNHQAERESYGPTRVYPYSMIIRVRFYANSDVNEWKSYGEVTLRPFQLRRSYDGGAGKKKKEKLHLERWKRLNFIPIMLASLAERTVNVEINSRMAGSYM